MTKTVVIIFNIARSLAAVIMLQTLFFKFTAAPESVQLFSEIGLEPTGRRVVGIFELLAAILLFIPRWIWLGAVIGIGLMLGAVFFHISILGIDSLFALALVTLVSSAFVLHKKRKQIPCWLWKGVMGKSKCS